MIAADILLLDGDARSTLAACRSLGARGLRVAVGGPKGCITHSSRYCGLKLVAPPTRSADYPNWLAKHATGVAMVLPMTDSSLDVALRIPELAPQLPFSSKELIDSIQEKDRLLQLAAQLGIAIPRSELVRRGSTTNWNSFPAALKGARAEQGSKGKQATLYPNSPLELRALLEQLPDGQHFLLQERIQGPGLGVFCLLEKGEPLVTFAHRRILEKPPSGGVSVLSMSIPLSEAPVAQAHSLLRELGLSGVAMVEFKRGVKGPVLMEINPRFWGTLQLCISSGVDLPYLLWLSFRGELNAEILAAAANYRVGQALRWDLGTLDHLLIRLKNEGLSALFGACFRNELQFFSGQSTAHETFCWSDPRPFLSEVGNYCKALL